MKQLFNLVIGSFLFYFSYLAYVGQVFAIFGDNTGGIRYCSGGDCGLDRGIAQVRQTLNYSETERSLSEYIQDVIGFALTFITLIAVVYIIYAGFRILIGNGDEEALKKSKSIIIYVILGLIVMWLAWAITTFIFDVLGA